MQELNIYLSRNYSYLCITVIANDLAQKSSLKSLPVKSTKIHVLQNFSYTHDTSRYRVPGLVYLRAIDHTPLHLLPASELPVSLIFEADWKDDSGSLARDASLGTFHVCCIVRRDCKETWMFVFLHCWKRITRVKEFRGEREGIIDFITWRWVW